MGDYLCPHFFQMATSQWKKGSGGPHDLSEFIMNFQNIIFFGFRDLEFAGTLNLHPLKLHSEAPNYIIRVNSS